ncbi:NADH dehydrogenase [ubiquinone] 1 alpha subcomplex assembly factor 4 [Hemicordylus capensis]|uniref:NADH dehydrogenase [ubiquinone] 1 alpha subcomplex assembly factor 4 n=1 Tax=Hemicordylus capensis TaxID=884348 RepID=UPI00230438C5|nr:NADH dehydrogenase [ubiquinone] 1 alpha subcomplex assembly factor 4 [Hemicordylus capensis]
MMGARVTRVFTNFNLESRAHREISKVKPSAAPRHPTTAPQDYPAGFQEEIKKKDERINILLKDVYVDSTDPPAHVKNESRILPAKPEEHRLTKVGHFGHLDIQTISKGKISVVEALTILDNHHRSPQAWTAERIAKEYSLELKDVTALLTFFIPFAVEIFPPKNQKALNSR